MGEKDKVEDVVDSVVKGRTETALEGHPGADSKDWFEWFVTTLIDGRDWSINEDEMKELVGLVYGEVEVDDFNTDWIIARLQETQTLLQEFVRRGCIKMCIKGGFQP